MGIVAGLIIAVIGIIILVWIFLGKGTSSDEHLIEQQKPEDENLPEKEPQAQLPEGSIERIKEVIGDAIKDKQVALIWDSFVDNPTDPDYFYLIAGALIGKSNDENERQENEARAEKILEMGVELLPEPSAEIFSLLGDLYTRRDALTEAVELYQKAIAIDETISRTFVNMGYALNKLGHFSEAAAELSRVVSKEPHNKPARINLAVAQIGLQQNKEAYDTLNELYRIDPSIPVVHYYIGVVCEKLGEPGVARKALERYIKMSPKGEFLIDAERLLEKLPDKENNNDETNPPPAARHTTEE